MRDKESLALLTSAVANLAAPADQQIRYLAALGKGVEPDELALEFDDAMFLSRALNRNGFISDYQYRLLLDLNAKLTGFSGKQFCDHWTLDAFAASTHWSEVRIAAQEFLNSLR